MVTRRPLRVSYDVQSGVLLACEWGTVPELRMADQRIVLGRVTFLLRRPRGSVVGFSVAAPTRLDLDAHQPDLWCAPRFAVPTLGLATASVGEVIARARAVHRRSTIDVHMKMLGHRHWASGRLGLAQRAFAAAVDAGDLEGHLQLAGVLAEQQCVYGAYDHARIYTELATRDARGWAARGSACLALGERREARLALRRAVRLERDGSYPTPAAAELERL